MCSIVPAANNELMLTKGGTNRQRPEKPDRNRGVIGHHHRDAIIMSDTKLLQAAGCARYQRLHLGVSQALIPSDSAMLPPNFVAA
jgi:hypothetical protein